jgi:hypothetical protein
VPVEVRNRGAAGSTTRGDQQVAVSSMAPRVHRRAPDSPVEQARGRRRAP